MLDTAYHITPSPNRVQGRHVVAVAEEQHSSRGTDSGTHSNTRATLLLNWNSPGYVHGEDRASDPGREVLSSRPMNPGVGHRTRMIRTPAAFVLRHTKRTGPAVKAKSGGPEPRRRPPRPCRGNRGCPAAHVGQRAASRMSRCQRNSFVAPKSERGRRNGSRGRSLPGG